MKKEKLLCLNTEKLLFFLEENIHNLPPPMSVMLIDDFGKNPFIILISCLLSLRARDTVTYPISKVLFARVKTPQQLLALPVPELERLFHSLGFYRRKTQIVRQVCIDLIRRFDSQVPSTEQELLSLPGVGRKTANLVLSEAFDVPAICVDTHVHRLANVFGLVSTKTPEQTEQELQKLLPKKWWRRINRVLVVWGQQVCKSKGAGSRTSSRTSSARCQQMNCPCLHRAELHV